MKKRICVAFLTLLMLLTMTACGGNSAESAPREPGGAAMDMAEVETEEVLMDGMSFGSAVSTTAKENAPYDDSAALPQKLIRTGRLELETTAFDESAQALADLVDAFGGYFENSSTTNRHSGARWGDYSIRVPAQRFEEFLNQAGVLCHETRREITQDDISESYYDTQGRLKTQQIKLERLQSLLAKAEAMEDIITIESAISETEWQIEQLSGTLRHYDNKVDYATVYITLNEVYKYSNVDEVPDSFGSRLGAAFGDGLRNFTDTLEDLAVSFAYNWIWWLLAAAAVIIIVRVVRKRGVKVPKLRRKNRDDKQNEN